MDLQETGKFIATSRKAKNLTQAKLAQILCVSEKTISKWECGNGFPDTTLMLPLCKALDISANELLSAKKLDNESYKQSAESNLVELKKREQWANKELLTLELVIGYMATISFMVCVFVASFANLETVWRILLIAFGLVNFVVGIGFAIKIEKDAGYYECSICHHKYVPTYKAVFLSMHHGRTRYLKCPKCHKKSWNKKTITKDK